jgi:hypothetical protein
VREGSLRFTAPAFGAKPEADRGSAYISQLRGLFENIAPHSNQTPEVKVLPARPVDSGAGAETNRELAQQQQYTLYDTPFIPLFDNFYLTDPIRRASITMGKCSTQFQSHNFPF